MPAKNPRMSITISPELSALLKRLARHQGVSAASVVSTLLQEAQPALERVCVALDRANEAQTSFLAGWKDAVTQAEEAIADSYGHLDGLLQMLAGDEGSPSEKPQEAGNGREVARADARPVDAPAASSGGGVNPRVVTRGSGTQYGEKLTNAAKGNKRQLGEARK